MVGEGEGDGRGGGKGMVGEGEGDGREFFAQECQGGTRPKYVQ